EGELPLSFAQQRLWFLDQLEPGSVPYNMPAALRLRGALDEAALAHVFGEVVRRHEVLRTTFAEHEGRPVQVIHPPGAAWALPRVDLSLLPEASREAAARQRAVAEAGLPFDLTTGPLLRTTLLRLAVDEHVLLVTMHHIVSDGWSIGVLVHEVAALYRAYHDGRPSPLPELAIQYADFAAWQRRWLTDEVLDTQLAYWKERLAGGPMLELPTDRPRPLVLTHRGAHHPVILSAELRAALERLGRERGATLFMVLMAAFQVLLARWSGQDDISVGTPVANRNRSEVEPLIGFFVNTLVMRADLSESPTFTGLLERVKEAALGAYAHQDLPFERLVEALRAVRDLGRMPLFEVMFALQNAPMEAMELPGLRMERLPLESGVAKFDLTLVLEETAGRLEGALEYNADLFDAATIARMAEHLEVLLRGVAATPDRRIDDLPLMAEAERHTLLVTWNATSTAFPREACIHQLFEAQVERAPDAEAVAFEDERLTYRALNERANRLAHHLRALGVGPESLVGLCLERSPASLVGLLGILKAGAAYVSIDPEYPASRLTFLLVDTGMKVLVTDAKLAVQLGAQLGALGDGLVAVDVDGPEVASAPSSNPVSEVGAESLAYVMYTSGSTGQPKGVCVPHRAVVRLALARSYVQLTADDVLLHFAPLSFDASTFEIWSALLHGAKVAIAPPGLLSLEELGRTLSQHAVTTLWLTAPLFHQMVDEHLEDLRGLRYLLAGGDALSPAHVAKALAGLPDCCLINGYGPTENTTFTCCADLRAWQERGGPLPIGRPIDDTRVYLLDAQLSPVPIGVAGEVYAAGDGLARGYLHRPELTAERFVPDPFSEVPGARLYRVGDLARWLPDGSLEFLGRVDHQVKIRGFRIELGEVEAALSRHPAVRACVAVAREDVPGNKRLVVYAALEEGRELSATELREHLQQSLPAYMLPSAFVVLDALPLNRNGKVNRRALPAPEVPHTEADASTAPRSAVEEALAKIWQEVLRLPRVGIHDNFFEVGGDSILTIQVVSRANQAGLRLTPKQLFQHPTIAGLATVVGEAKPIEAEQGWVTGPVALTPVQRWFFDQASPAPHHFNQAVMFEVPASLDPTMIERALAALVEHHDALRLRFTREASGWTQRHAALAESAPSLWRVDLSTLPDDQQRRAIEAKAAEAQASLDLAAGPLLRAVWLHLGADRPGRLLLVVHHLVVDGISWRVLL
ncbi:MAG: amino acid adenylation domain-containing protein, partial [Byssovorax sp.]